MPRGPTILFCAYLAFIAHDDQAYSDIGVQFTADCEITVEGDHKGNPGKARLSGVTMGEGWCVRLKDPTVKVEFVDVQNLHFCDEPTS